MEENLHPAHRNGETQMVPLFQAENTVMHLGFANRRMLIALITVCVTFIITILVFVFGYTVREKNWLDTITRMNATPATEAADGVQQQPGD